MPEAVIVATARSPIGRAFKGSLTSIRPDDIAVQMVSAALAKVPLKRGTAGLIESATAAVQALSKSG